MDKEQDVTDSSTEEVVEETEEVSQETEEPEETESAPEEPESKEPKAEKTVPYDRFKKVNTELAKLKAQPAKVKTSLDVEDYIDISASLEGLDQKQKEYLAREHKLTGLPLSEIRNSEDFLLWNSGYQSKVEKEKALKPSGTQPESERKKSPLEQITSAKGLKDQEEMLRKYGLYKESRPRADRSTIG